MKDNAAKLSADSKGKLETAASAVKEALKGTDVAAIKAASERLNETWQAVSTELYQAADKTHAGKGPGDDQSGKQPEAEHHHEENQKSEEPVIDAEVVDEHQPA
jgi:molecular chaperone DnaK